MRVLAWPSHVSLSVERTCFMSGARTFVSSKAFSALRSRICFLEGEWRGFIICQPFLILLYAGGIMASFGRPSPISLLLPFLGY